LHNPIGPNQYGALFDQLHDQIAWSDIRSQNMQGAINGEIKTNSSTGPTQIDIINQQLLLPEIIFPVNIHQFR
jgi:hypothetical protein